MNLADVCWLLVYSATLGAILLVHHYIIKYIKSKAPGSTSIHDVAFQDTLNLTRFSGTLFCSIAIISRFELVRNLMNESPRLVALPCALYIFAFVSVCVNAGCLCIIRILCMINMTMMEDTVQESLTRAASVLFTAVSGFSACLLLYVNEDINSGTAMTMLTHKMIPTGPIRDLVNSVVFAFVVVSCVIMQSYAEWQKFQLKKIDPCREAKIIDGVVKKSGLASLLVVSVAFGHLSFGFWFPTGEKNQNYYLLKDLITCLLLDVAIPAAVIAKNENMKKFIKPRILGTRLFKILKRFRKLIRNKFQPRNKIEPIFFVDVTGK